MGVVADRDLPGGLILGHAGLADQVLVLSKLEERLGVVRVLRELRLRGVDVVLELRRPGIGAAIADAEGVEDPSRPAAHADAEAQEADDEEQRQEYV